MQQFIIGRKGNQKFPISDKYNRVSSNHVKLTITDNEEWWIEDMGSSNGTFIQDENGDFQRVNKKRIDEFTRIALGGNCNGCFVFVAHHVLENYSDNPEEEANNYCAEFLHVLEVYERLERERSDVEDKQRSRTKLKMIPPIVTGIVGVTIILLGFKDWLTYVTYALTQLFTLGMLVYELVVPEKGDLLELLKTKRKKLCVCPHCNLDLDNDEVTLQCCNHCKAHA